MYSQLVTVPTHDLSCRWIWPNQKTTKIFVINQVKISKGERSNIYHKLKGGIYPRRASRTMQIYACSLPRRETVKFENYTDN